MVKGPGGEIQIGETIRWVKSVKHDNPSSNSGIHMVVKQNKTKQNFSKLSSNRHTHTHNKGLKSVN